MPNGTNSSTYRLMVNKEDDGEEEYECVELIRMMMMDETDECNG